VDIIISFTQFHGYNLIYQSAKVSDLEFKMALTWRSSTSFLEGFLTRAVDEEGGYGLLTKDSTMVERSTFNFK
jgi:hypothetical protein